MGVLWSRLTCGEVASPRLLGHRRSEQRATNLCGLFHFARHAVEEWLLFARRRRGATSRVDVKGTFRVAAATSQLGGEPTQKGSPRERSDCALKPGIPGTNGLNRLKRPYAKRSISARASAISGTSGVGAKPSSARARTAWASTGRAVD